MIPFNKPYITGNELNYIKAAYEEGKLSGDGKFTKICSEIIEKHTNTQKALLTHSCTAAIEMAAILLKFREGDEFITPSYTFVSTVNPFILRGGVPRFVDIRKDTLNIDENLIEKEINQKTKAIVIVHYAGVSCDMDKIMKIAKTYNLPIVEDAAHAISSKYKKKPLGSLGSFGTLSFHETKNIIAGEGGALLINDEKYIERAEIIREKGTNRKKFLNGEVDKYSWVDIGSSFLPGELISAFLLGQLENLDSINKLRINIWKKYYNSFLELANKGIIKIPFIPNYCEHNGHLFYIVLRTKDLRDNFISHMKTKGISCVFHYIPLHSSDYGKKIVKNLLHLENTNKYSERIVRLPLWIGIEKHLEYIIDEAINFLLRA
tara:strand:+ start:82300 stop:83430 length:1131 start_codon:yes stop_codon:yes gene_type:complete